MTTFFCLSVGTDGASSFSFADNMSAQAESAAADGMLVFDELMFAGTGSAPSAYQLIIAMNPDRRDSLYDYVGTRASVYQSLEPKAVFAIAFLVSGAALAALFLLLPLIAKGKARSMRTNSLIIRFKDRVIRGVRAFYLHRRVTGKLTVCAAGFAVISLFLFWLRIRTGAWFYLSLLVVFWAVIFLLLLYKCVQKQKVKDGIEEIAGGNLEYQIDVLSLSGDERNMAEDLNRVRVGMKSAVEEQVKSERMS